MNGPEKGASGNDAYSATALRPSILLLDHLMTGLASRSNSVVLDMESGLYTLVEAQLPTQEEAKESLFIVAHMDVIVLRWRHPNLQRPFKTPFYPLP